MLSRTQIELIEYLQEKGLTVREIANTLKLSVNTVKKYLTKK